jgi:TRAP transporter TAXI family solute receptor
MMRKALLFVSLFSLTLLAQAAEQRFISIGTGGLTGVYYPAGGAICRLINRNRRSHGIRCAVESTGGSIFNLNTLANRELDFAIAQSDWQLHAYQGSSKFKAKGPNKDLRAVFAIHSEPFTVVARTDSGVKTLADLKGKRVNVGNPGSGQRGTLEELMVLLGWSMDDFKLVAELKASEQSRALCDNKIDVMIFMAGHPNAAIKEATTACDARLVQVEGAAVQRLIDSLSYYAPATIPAGMYRGNDFDAHTFGSKATLVSRADVDDEVVYQLVKAVFENLEAMRRLHPAFAHLTPQSMLQGNSAPYHPGALRYYREAGLIE